MEISNVGKYASVEDLENTPRRLTFRRGYGNIVSTTFVNNEIKSKATPYNRLQPVNGNFGNHNPETADPVFKMLNPQTKLAWDNTQQQQNNNVYQNVNLLKLPSKDSTLEN